MIRIAMVTLVVLVLSLPFKPSSAAEEARRPNIVLIVADDLGYAELGCYGQKKIRTPRLDQLAAEGMRFTDFYSGNAVCAPSRCVLMTGKHPGHAAIRDNREVQPEGQFPLPAGEVTLPQLLARAGYTTAAMGKWGLGPPGSTGDPGRCGIDLFYGYNCQRQAHNHYPAYFWRNDKKETIAGNDGRSPTGKQYALDLFEGEALAFIRAHRERPFFLFLPVTVPHLALQAPEDAIAEYKDKWDDPPYTGGKGYLPHPTPRAAYAAMITRMDRMVGRIVDELKQLKLDDNTLVLFTSDNGPTYDRLGGSDSEFFQSAGPLSGLKGSLHEGGIRVPLVVRFPGKIPAGSTSKLPGGFCDMLPTFCEAAGVKPPEKIDGVSLWPTLTGKGRQADREFLYWEFPSYGQQQAVRMGRWKGIRSNLAKGNTQIALFDLETDVGEAKNVAADHPDLVERIARIMQREHTPSPDFPLATIDPPKATKK